MSFGQTSQAGDMEVQKGPEEYIKKLVDSSTVYYNSGNYSKSLELNVKIVQTAEEMNDTTYLQNGYRYLGYDYLILQDTLLAKKNFEKSQEFASLSKNETALGLSYMDLANLHGYSKRSLNKALDYHNKSISIFKKLNDSSNLSNAYFNTVLTLNKYDRLDESLVYLREADKLKYLMSNRLRANVHNQWARYFIKNKNYEKAEYYLSEILLDTVLHESRFELADAYWYYSRIYFNQKKYKEAYLYSEKYQNLYEDNHNKLQSEESQRVAASFQLAEYKKDIEKTELQNELQSEILKSKNSLNKLLLVILAISILLLLFLYIVYRKRKEFIKKLESKNQEYLEAKEESERLSKSKTDFFSTVSHELRTPLYGVIGLSTILMEDDTLQTHKEDIKSLKFSADYLMALINDVLQISKIDSKGLDEDQVVFDIRELVKVIIPSFEYIRIQHNNTIRVDIAEDVPAMIKGDSIRLSQVFMNLIGNACKFTENGLITIHISTVLIGDTETTLHFSVKDNGIGIPAEKQVHIFDEFAQVSSKHYNYQGTGLGLPIVKKLLALSDAEIKLDSTIGEGSNFYFDLRFDHVIDASIIETPTTTMLDEEVLKGKHILIVDDNRINQIVTTKILEKRGVQCSLASNGEEAIAIAKKASFDLILMDIHMPEKNGMEATLAIRMFNPNIPIIALTAVEVKEMRHRIYESGMNDIIVKPYDITKFKRTILRNIICPIDLEQKRRRAL
jgi:signal transduction histidine kinase/CheY-like chemotaxis protein